MVAATVSTTITASPVLPSTTGSSLQTTHVRVQMVTMNTLQCRPRVQLAITNVALAAISI